MATLEELALICEQYGENVAWRAYAASLPAEERTLSLFYSIKIEDDDPFPGFGPIGLSSFYPPVQLTEFECQWARELHSGKEFWGSWILNLIHCTVVTPDGNEAEVEEAADRIANDVGELELDDGRCCVWFPEWRGWTAWFDHLTPVDIEAIKVCLSPRSSRKPLLNSGVRADRHPEPGSSEAEAFMKRRDERIAGRDKSDNQKEHSK